MGSKLTESLKCWQIALFILPTLAGYKILDFFLTVILFGVRGEEGGSQGQLEFGLIVKDFTYII